MCNTKLLDRFWLKYWFNILQIKVWVKMVDREFDRQTLKAMTFLDKDKGY